MDRASVLRRPGGFRTVVLATGHMTDLPDRGAPRFPESAVPDVEVAVDRALDGWGLGTGDLLICGGARGGDLLAARVADRRGATVWLLLATDVDRFEAGSVAGAAPGWVAEFRRLVHRVPSWVLDEPPAAEPGDVYAAANASMLTVALVQADDRPVHVLAVWDGQTADGPGGAADLIERAEAVGAPIIVIDPSSLGAGRVGRGGAGRPSTAPATAGAPAAKESQ